jgi:hypothetical protein
MEWDPSELAELNAFQQEWERMKEEIDSLKRENSHILKQADPQKSPPSDDEKKYQDGREVGDEEQVGAWRIYLGSNAYKVDLPDEELFFDTLKDAMKKIDEINEDSCSIKLSYDTIDFEWYGSYEKSDEESD